MKPEYDPQERVLLAIKGAVATNTLDEFTWVDFKSRWPDLTKPEDWNEFLKDVASFANSGGDGYLIFGVGPVVNGRVTLSDAAVSMSGLVDASNIQQKVAASTSHPIRVEIGHVTHDGKTLGFAWIPNSHNRPHLILSFTRKSQTRYNNALFWREGSTTYGPGDPRRPYPERSKLDEMFLDRPEQATMLEIRTWPACSARWGGESDMPAPDQYFLHLPLTIANGPDRKVGIRAATANVKITHMGLSPEKITVHRDRAVLRWHPATHPAKQEFPFQLDSGSAQNLYLMIPISIAEWMPDKEAENAKRRVAAEIVLHGFFGASWSGEVSCEVKT